MKMAFWWRLTSLTLLGLGISSGGNSRLLATTFNHQELDQNKVIAIAAPVSNPIGIGAAYNLLILEQINNNRDCWRESGTNPTTIEPLLLNFDFTGICDRSTDSNGYSIRVNGVDLSWRYILRLVKSQGDLKLVAVSTENRNIPEIEIGSTQGIPSNFGKIILNPGWRLTKRVYNGRPLGHIYFTNNEDLNSLIAAASNSQDYSSPTENLPTTTVSNSSTESRPTTIIPSSPTEETTAPSLPAPPDISNSSESAYPSPWIEFNSSSTPPSPQASNIGLNYRVIVPISNSSSEDRVRSLIPNAFRTRINGQVVMQAGLFQEQGRAYNLQQRLRNNGLDAKVIPVN